MDPFQVNMQAKFDQINACHRDAMAAARQFSESLFRLPVDEQREVIDTLHPLHRELMLVLAEESGNERLVDLLREGEIT